MTEATEVLARKYRPKTFAEVVGQNAIVRSLESLIARRAAQTFLLAGPSGVGKTTLARIAAHKLGCQSKDIMEINAAKYTGVDDMRAVEDAIQYRPFGASSHRSAIVDECHMLSKSAWNSLLKVTEEPPSHMSWFFCTTEVNKVPATIKTRSAAFTLKLVDDSVLNELVTKVSKAEKIKLPSGVQDLIVKEAHGSPRQVLVNLAVCRDIGDRKEAADILKAALESDATIELCRFLLQGGSWAKAVSIVAKITDPPESVRRVVCAYMTKVLQGAKTTEAAVGTIQLLEAFATPYPDEQVTHLYLSVGRALLSE